MSKTANRSHPASGGGKSAESAVFDPSILFLRAWIAGMLAATIWVTRRLWTERAEPPLLPWIELPSFDAYGELLLGTACLYVVWPRIGLAANVVVGLIAMTADQTRMQPQMFSFWLMMLGTWPNPAARLLGRTHLASLWMFSGLHKLLSPDYYTDVGPWMWSGLFPVEQWPSLAVLAKPFGVAVAATELLLGCAIWWLPARRIVAAVGALLHVGIVVMLYRMDWNSSVWGWNLALAAAATVLIGGWRTSLAEDLKNAGRWAAVVAALLLLSPALYYVGRLDAYLCHCLYSQNVPTAEFFPGLETPGRPYRLQGLEGPYWKNLNVPQPPTHRNFEIYFRRVARPGDELVVRDSRLGPIPDEWRHYAWRRDERGFARIPLP